MDIRHIYIPTLTYLLTIKADIRHSKIYLIEPVGRKLKIVHECRLCSCYFFRAHFCVLEGGVSLKFRRLIHKLFQGLVCFLEFGLFFLRQFIILHQRAELFKFFSCYTQFPGRFYKSVLEHLVGLHVKAVLRVSDTPLVQVFCHCVIHLHMGGDQVLIRDDLSLAGLSLVHPNKFRQQDIVSKVQFLVCYFFDLAGTDHIDDLFPRDGVAFGIGEVAFIPNAEDDLIVSAVQEMPSVFVFFCSLVDIRHVSGVRDDYYSVP